MAIYYPKTGTASGVPVCNGDETRSESLNGISTILPAMQNLAEVLRCMSEKAHDADEGYARAAALDQHAVRIRGYCSALKLFYRSAGARPDKEEKS